ncbi:hypothetical protein ACEV7Y_23840, partial [Vibrio parahaemolyticus]
IQYTMVPGPAGSGTKIEIGGKQVAVDKDFVKNAVAAAGEAGYPKAGDARILKAPSFAAVFASTNALTVVGLLTIL